MTAAIARFLSLSFQDQLEAEIFETIVIVCGIGLTTSLLLARYGLDLSPGFF
jgi:hypothetical protein